MTDWPAVATRAIKAGLAVIPVRRENKKPFGEWGMFKDRLPTGEEVAEMFGGRNGDASMAVCTGTGSGLLEAIDFEDYRAPVFEEWRQIATENGLEGVLARLVVQQSGRGGRHVFYRCDACEGNQKLARTPEGECLIETRGLGGYILVAPSEGYKLIQGRFSQIPTITPEERAALLTVARLLNQHIEPQKMVRHERTATGADMRPGDDLNLRGDWAWILSGWKDVRRKVGGNSAWQRPGDTPNAWSATTGGRANGEDMLYVFTSSAPPFEPNHGYSKFSAYTLIHHAGDAAAAAKALAALGYGSPAKAKATVKDWNRMEGEKTVREMRTDDLAAKFAHVKSIDAYEEEMPEFLPGWEPYIRTGQMTDLVAKGESGKTTFLTAIAAGGSIGRGFAGEACEPFKTVYFACEDDPGEIRGVYRECGGLDGDWLIPWKDLLTLNDSGLDELDDILTYFKPRLIAFDSTKYYMPEGIKAMFDNVGIARLCNNIRPVLQKHRCGCVSVRHTKQSVKGIPMTDWGEGGDQWRNSARSQMVMVRHPKTPRQAGIWHTKASLRAGRGEPFQVGFSAGELCYTKGAYFEDYGLEEKQVPSFGVIPRGERGPAPAKLQAAMDALILLLSSGPKPYHSVLDLASKAAECSRSLLFEAKKQLGLVYSEADKTLALPADFDMFEDPREGGGGNPWWSEK